MATREYRALTEGEVLAELLTPAPTVICCHARPDADCVGSAFALSLFLAATGSPSYVVCADEIPERLRFLTEGLQESMRYESLPTGFLEARVVTVDVSSPSQLGALFDVLGDRVSLMIDHHERGEVFADHHVVHHASCAEIVFDLIAASGISVPPRAASLIYAGLSSDTGCFRYSNVKRDTHLRAAALVDMGIDAAEINRQLFEVKSPLQITAERLGAANLKLFSAGRIAVTAVSYAERMANGLADEHLGTLIDVARAVRGALLAAAIRENGAGEYRVSLRANADFDVAAAAATLGGGGHRRAAGVTVRAASMADATQIIVGALEALLGGAP